MRWIFRVVGALVVLVVALVALVAMMPAERIAGIAADQFARTSGRTLKIEGKVSPRFWPTLGVATGPVSIANAEWSKQPGPMFAADSLLIEINPMSLFGGDIRILGIEAENPKVLLERGRDGRGNWEFGSTEPAAPSGAASGDATTARGIVLEQGRIRGATLRWLDHASGQDITLDDADIRLAIPDRSGPFNVRGEGLISGRKLSFALDAGSFSGFTEGRVVPLTLSASAGGSSLSFNGRAGLSPMVAEGALEADLSDLAALAALAGAEASRPPAGFGRDSLKISGTLTLDEKGTAYLRAARILADNNTITGELDLAPGKDRPKISARLRSDALDMKGVSGGQGGGAGGGMQAEGWPTERIDVSALGVLDAVISLDAGSVDLGAVKFGQTRLMLTLDRSRAVFDIGQLAAYGGAVTGQFVVNGRGGLSVGGDLNLANLQMQPLLVDLSGWDRLSSAGNLNLKFLAVGNSMDALMRSLKGDGSLSLGKGELKGLDIAGMLRTLNPNHVGEGQKTIFDGIAGSFTILNGVLTNSDLKLMAPYVTATGNGDVDIGNRRLAYRLRPTALPGADGSGGIMVPLLITGPWAKPNFHLDLESVARERMEAEAKAAEARLKEEAKAAEIKAKADLEAKLKEELGVEAAEGEKIEDAIKRRAEEALKEKAGGLLDGLLGGR